MFLEININIKINNIIFFLKNKILKNFKIIIYFIKITLIFLNSIFMKNQLFNSQKISLFLFLIGTISCHEIPDTSQVVDELGSELFVSQDSEYEAKLKTLSLYMGQVFQDPSARAELFGFSKMEGNQGEISIELSKLFEGGVVPSAKKKSTIVAAFSRGRTSKTSSSTVYSTEELIAFIKDYKIGIVAPYLAENFEEASLSQMTVSWWTQEFEDWKLNKDQEWQGETKASIVDFSKDRVEFHDQREFWVNDAYAKKNPTIVLGSFDFGNEIGKDNRESTSGENFAIQSFVNSANCQDLNQSSVVRLLMPELMLTSPIRSWPHPDRLTLIIVLGTNPGGNASSNTIFSELEIKRGATGQWRTSPGSFIMVLFNKRPSNSDEIQVTAVIKVNPEGETESQVTTVGNKTYTQLHFSQTFNKCGTINNPFTDRGFGQRTYLGVDYGIERFGKFQFYLVPQIQML